jgi:sugar O-acyltransferase (sialic acid O-acetyltransferase NeuD family)
MAERVFIFGAGGHAHVIASMIEDEPTFLVPGTPGDGEMSQADFFSRLPIFGSPRIYIGVGDNIERRRIFLSLKEAGARVSNCIGRNTFIARDAQLGEGLVICPGSVIGSRARVGNNTIINTLSSVDHDCVLGDHSQVTAGVTLGGTVKVGMNCFFGIKSAVIPEISIGNNVVVMAGAVVTKNLPDDVLAGGYPARVMRQLRNDE